MSGCRAPSFARADDVETSPAGDRVVLYHRRSKCALVLNPTASWIWTRLREATSLDGLVIALTHQYPDLPVEQARTDVKVLLEELLAQGVLVARP